MSSPPLTRRTFIRNVAAGTGLALASGPVRAVEAAPSILTRTRSGGTARNVVFFVADGMTNGTLALANHYLRLTQDRPSHWMRLYEERQAIRSLMETNSANSLVTDSAAASCAWACGRRINNDVVNLTPEGAPLDPILRIARRAGMGTGLVSTARLTHATPAGWVAQVANRNLENDIAVQELEQRIDVLLGGGIEFFDPDLRRDRRNLLGEFAEAGYRVLRSRTDWQGAGDSPVLGCFHRSHLPYTVDRNQSAELQATVPTLAEMTGWALDQLSRHDEGFVLQVEGGRVDTAAHSNDAAATLHDQIAFDDAVGVGIEFSRRHPETLVIITTDHGTGGMVVNGLGSGYRNSGPGILTLGQVTSSIEMLNSALRAANRTERADIIRSRLAADLSPAELDQASAAYDRVNTREGSVREAEIMLGRQLSQHNAVGFTTGNHTGDLVELCAFGPGSERIPGFIENHALFNVMTSALGLPV